MARHKAKAVEVPTQALACYDFNPIHYADAFRIVLEMKPPMALAELAHQLFGRRESFPIYVGWLFYLRDILVKPFNIRSTSQVNSGMARGDRTTFFELLQETEHEIVLGEDDGHLDFRVSLLRSHDRHQAYLTVTTFVRTHNLVGRIYFAAIKPFHRMVIMGTMRRALG